MRYLVVCPRCPLDVSTGTETEATALRRRHHGLVGHRADITQVLETPFEGLLGGCVHDETH